jgi:HEPN domain-containing protein
VSGSPRRAVSWLEQAEFDLEAARLSLEHGYFEWASFQSQQSAEKAIKGLLVLMDGYAPRGHRLGGLMTLVGHFNPQLRQSLNVSIADLEAATFVSRYPFAIPTERMSPHEFIEKEDAVACLNEATQLVQRIQQATQNLSLPSNNL